MFSSLRGRLFTSTLVILMLFLGGAGLGLDQAYRSSLENGANEQLQLHLYSLLSAANEIDGKLFLPEALQEPRFNELNSGLYGAVISDDSAQLWSSESSLGVGFTEVAPLSPGETRFGIVKADVDASFYQLAFGVVWEGVGGVEHIYTFLVRENVDRYQVQSASFRNELWRWLAGLGVFLLIAQWLVLRWGLSPLGVLARQVALIEEGQTQRLEGRFPLEIARVVNNLNQLVAHEHRQRERYKNTLGDLAHSLKTPLAVLRGSSGEIQNASSHDDSQGHAQNQAQKYDAFAEVVDAQVTRMDQIVEYQLKRAVASGAVQLGKSVAVSAAAEKLLSTLDKVYRDKQVRSSVNNSLPIGGELMFAGDEGDLLEIMGNLLDNAYKHCRNEVKLSLFQGDADHVGVLLFDDDGDGVPAEIGEQILRRGVRADTETPGQGIGLAVVQDIVMGYQGKISINRSSSLGGASIRVELPCVVSSA